MDFFRGKVNAIVSRDRCAGQPKFAISDPDEFNKYRRDRGALSVSSFSARPFPPSPGLHTGKPSQEKNPKLKALNYRGIIPNRIRVKSHYTLWSFLLTELTDNVIALMRTRKQTHQMRLYVPLAPHPSLCPGSNVESGKQCLKQWKGASHA